MEFTINQIAQGAGIFFGAVGMVVYGAKKNGYLTFGKPKERRSCAHTCREHAGLVKEVRINTVALEKIERKVDNVDGKVDRILGHLGKL